MQLRYNYTGMRLDRSSMTVLLYRTLDLPQVVLSQI